MVFSDLFFLFVFIPTFAICYLVGAWIDKQQCRKSDTTHILRFKNLVLVLFSLLFYAWGEPVYVFLMLLCVLFNYLSGLLVNKHQGVSRKWFLAIGVAMNLLILGTFKYLSFFICQLNAFGLGISDPRISLPIGISFYIFQSISYLVDVYRRESPVQHRFVDLLLYISMFPQLIAGPIVRYGTVAHEINDRHVSARDFADGAYRFFIGLGKKVILANQLSEISDLLLVKGFNDMTTTGAWLGIIAFTLQIYFDFSGYSDMAIGIGRCLGFHFNENFNHPYCCKSITDFWRRWHMSLGSFFRDYVYIPLGGNRSHQVFNILVVWFLTGMWHGASWNFIIWGLYFGFIVMIEKYTLLRIHNRAFSPLLHLYSLVIVIIGWGIFYFDDLGQMTTFFHAFCGHAEVFHDFITTSVLTDNCWLWVISLLLSMPVRTGLGRLCAFILPQGSFLNNLVVFTSRTIISIVILCLSVALLVGATNNAFIYTRF
ncbi:MAG: MBOAT family protein [Prevotellaceae bacterium]|nr:MBOAT family protein [Prevotellaceae bacterium]